MPDLKHKPHSPAAIETRYTRNHTTHLSPCSHPPGPQPPDDRDEEKKPSPGQEFKLIWETRRRAREAFAAIRDARDDEGDSDPVRAAALNRKFLEANNARIRAESAYEAFVAGVAEGRAEAMPSSEGKSLGELMREAATAERRVRERVVGDVGRAEEARVRLVEEKGVLLGKLCVF